MNYEKQAEILKAIGHPVRLKMVQGLMHNECNVGKIVDKLGLPQSTVSQHLGILKAQGIIKAEKQGVRTCYQVVNKDVKKIIYLLKKK